MKKVIIVRHGKSDKDDSDDFGRNLNKKGEEDSGLLGKTLYKLEGNPQFMVTSPAIRAVQTDSIIVDNCFYKLDITEFDFLYPGNRDGVQRVLEKTEDSIDYVIIVGHNPSFEEAASKLVSKYGNSIHLSTSSAVCLKSDAKSWRDFIAEETHKIEWILTPKLIETINN